MQTHEWEALLDEATPTSATGLVIPTNADERLHRHTRAAVAEVIRLRKAMEAVRDECRRNAYLDSWLSQFGTAPLEPFFNEVADALTRILEGDNNA